MQIQFKTGLVWFRRDLRTEDNVALTTALASCSQVYCVFVFDRTILDSLPRSDRRVEFIRESLVELDTSLRALAAKPLAGLIVLHDRAIDAIPTLASELGAQAIFAAHDYEPQAQTRDLDVRQALAQQQIAMVTVKDHVMFERREILNQLGKPYGVFTPYKRAWLAKLGDGFAAVHARPITGQVLAERPTHHASPVPTLESLGFCPINLKHLGIGTGMSGGASALDDFWLRMDDYDRTRDFPSVKGPSYLGVHLRFGTVSIRHLVALALQRQLHGSAGASVWLSELAWRDFYFQILANFPYVAERAFKPEYDQIQWEQGDKAQALFEAWCQGVTGYPLVDAAMAQLNQTGYMHNRLRMVAGSFLVKHLGIDWHWGERYFALKLNDFDLSANNGGWQWVSSSGCDAQPYFRIFNPIHQSERFDAQGKFIQRYVPQLAQMDPPSIHAPWSAPATALAAAGVVLGQNYPKPIVDHAQARALTLQRYGVVRKVTQTSTAVAQ
ncbi:MAG: deoxyribodipyrimidine photolyase [Burkholderiales bacterium RIFCSPLOWO2_12_FULL_61_40]|nr:MAG: deoxyribodipyrimidine photolyase [Burkholderiales bacterium RIFCSPLOWO2_12_FULL_61_40]